ncbi:MAG: hypothetical protein ACRCVT_12315 [Leadbetterella sp.]
MKRVFFVLILGFVSHFSFAQSTEDVVNKYLEFTNLSSKMSMWDVFQYSQKYTAPGKTEFTETITMQVSESKYSKKKSILDKDFYYVFSKNQGWIKIPTGSRDKVTKFTIKDFTEKENTEYQMEVSDGLVPFYNSKEKGYTVNLTSESLGADAVSVLVLEKNGFKKSYYFEANTGKLIQEISVKNGVTSTTKYTNYSDFDGMKLPSSATYINSKDNIGYTLAISWNFNNPLNGVSFGR